MKIKQAFIEGRSHLAAMFGLLTTAVIVFFLSDFSSLNSSINTVENELDIKYSTSIPKIKHTPLTEKEQQYARIAWKYFENNTIEKTGLVNSVDGFKMTTLWDTASYLLGLISAEKLGIIDRTTFQQRVAKILETLEKIPLYNNELPNKSYNTKTLQMNDYNNKPTEKGIGWSALDIGRLFVPLHILIYKYDGYVPQIRKIVSRWKFDRLFKNGLMYGTHYNRGREQIWQEGRLGYEEYVAKSFALLGFDVSKADRYDDWLGIVDIYDVKIHIDTRAPEKFGAHTYLLSEPYVLDGIEFGWDRYSAEFAYRIYKVQEQRYQQTGIFTAVSEDNIDQPPYFVYNTIITDGRLWHCISEKGRQANEMKTVSTKAAFGWHYLYNTGYTKKLFDQIEKLYDPEKGWYAGRYEINNQPNKALACNTNGIILEILYYKVFGPMVNFHEG